MDYEELEYIGGIYNWASATSYIDTGIIPNGMGIEARISDFRRFNSAAFGIYTDNDRILLMHRNGAVWYSSPSNAEKSVSGYALDHDVHTYSMNVIPGVLAIDGTTVANDVKVNTDLDHSLILFAQYDKGNINMSSQAHIHWFKIYDSDTLVADMRPARRLTDNAIGMYDTVRGVFLENIGIGAFVAGEPTGRYF